MGLTRPNIHGPAATSYIYMWRVERAVAAINIVPVVAGGSTIVATFSAEELAVRPLHPLEEQRSATTSIAGGVAGCFQKGAAKTVTTTRACYIFALTGFRS